MELFYNKACELSIFIVEWISKRKCKFYFTTKLYPFLTEFRKHLLYVLSTILKISIWGRSNTYKNTVDYINTIERGVFQHLPFLEVLEIEASLNNTTVLQNLTGENAEMPKTLKTVQLNRNMFHKLGPNTITGLSNVEQLYIQSSNLKSVTVSAFSSISKTIRNLFLDIHVISQHVSQQYLLFFAHVLHVWNWLLEWKQPQYP